VLDSPIAEGGIVATAIGMSVNGLRPVAEIQFADYIYPAYDQIVSELARIRYRTGGEFNAPVTIRTPCGGGIRGGQTHSQSPEALFAHVCGIKVVMPSNPYDAKGLLISSIEDDDPVVFFEPKRLYNGPFDGDPHKPAIGWNSHPKGDVPDGHYRVPIGAAQIVRPGKQVTVVTYGTMVHVCIAAAESLGIDAEVIDIRTIVPLDEETIVNSVKKTGRCVVAHEATRFAGFGAEILSIVQEECFWHLEAPIQRVAGWDTPYPHAFEWEYFPGQTRVAAALKATVEMK
jgi:2-oxoisovalerate dehydrogenase E1 component beta subunit